jgi:hypothetical protein
VIISKITTSSKIKTSMNVKKYSAKSENIPAKKNQYNGIENAVDYDPQLWESQSQVSNTSWKANNKKYKV